MATMSSASSSATPPPLILLSATSAVSSADYLDTGRLEIVPGLEVPADWFPPPLGMAFSADGRWLMIAINAGPQIRLLAWRPGLAHPYESKPITGPVISDVPILVLPKRTGH
jgi:hypothetical protein